MSIYTYACTHIYIHIPIYINIYIYSPCPPSGISGLRHSVVRVQHDNPWLETFLNMETAGTLDDLAGAAICNTERGGPANNGRGGAANTGRGSSNIEVEARAMGDAGGGRKGGGAGVGGGGPPGLIGGAGTSRLYTAKLLAWYEQALHCKTLSLVT